MIWLNAFWWCAYAAAAIVLQSIVPGVDMLLPGLLLAFQEGRITQMVIVGASFLLLQEGMGSMAFGGTLLWYALAAIAFFIGCRLFQSRSLLFVFLLCCLLGLAHYAVFGALATLQDIPWDSGRLMEECVLQALFTPLVWLMAQALRRNTPHEAHEQ